jgi:hypothetical protein
MADRTDNHNHTLNTSNSRGLGVMIGAAGLYKDPKTRTKADTATR